MLWIFGDYGVEAENFRVENFERNGTIAFSRGRKFLGRKSFPPNRFVKAEKWKNTTSSKVIVENGRQKGGGVTEGDARFADHGGLRRARIGQTGRTRRVPRHAQSGYHLPGPHLTARAQTQFITQNFRPRKTHSQSVAALERLAVPGRNLQDCGA